MNRDAIFQKDDLPGQPPPLTPAAIDVEELQRLWEAVPKQEGIHEKPSEWYRFAHAAFDQMPALLARIRELEEWQTQTQGEYESLVRQNDTARQSITRLREALKESSKPYWSTLGHFWTDAEIDAVERGGE